MDGFINIFVRFQGVKRVVNELEDWKVRIEKECIAHKEQNLKISESLNNFLEKQSYVSILMK